MDRRRRVFAFLLSLVTIAFIAFVVMMQQNFANPEFATAQSQSTEREVTPSDKASDSKQKEVDDVDETESETEEDDEIESEAEEDTKKTKYVAVSLLNIRSEPTADGSFIVTTLQHQDEVEVEAIEESDEWVQVTTDDITGYVKDKYLDDK